MSKKAERRKGEGEGLNGEREGGKGVIGEGVLEMGRAGGGFNDVRYLTAF